MILSPIVSAQRPRDNRHPVGRLTLDTHDPTAALQLRLITFAAARAGVCFVIEVQASTPAPCPAKPCAAPATSAPGATPTSTSRAPATASSSSSSIAPVPHHRLSPCIWLHPSMPPIPAPQPLIFRCSPARPPHVSRRRWPIASRRPASGGIYVTPDTQRPFAGVAGAGFLPPKARGRKSRRLVMPALLPVARITNSPCFSA